MDEVARIEIVVLAVLGEEGGGMRTARGGLARRLDGAVGVARVGGLRVAGEDAAEGGGVDRPVAAGGDGGGGEVGGGVGMRGRGEGAEVVDEWEQQQDQEEQMQDAGVG